MALRFSNGRSLYDVTKVETISGRPLEVIGGVTYTDVTRDSFGRQRVANPYTLFDSKYRYFENSDYVTTSGTGGSKSFDADASLVELTTSTTSGSVVTRQTTKTFVYQPGKSLLFLSSIIFGDRIENCVKQAGYYNDNNGFFLEQDSLNEPTFVKRSSSSGSVVNTKVSQSNWNVDKLDGTGESGITLDLTKVQVLWFDFEWLGSGTVRCGFIIGGVYVLCHVFEHANVIDTTYMTTATLPIQFKIENTDTTTTSGNLKQICCSVISEGGYVLEGHPFAINTPISTPTDLPATGIYYPLISLRLKSANLDAAIILENIAALGITNNANYNVQLIQNGTTSGGSWVSAGSDSSVEYNITATGFTKGDGTVLIDDYAIGSAQGSTPLNLNRSSLFKYQLERDGLNSTAYEMTLIAATDNAGADVHGSIGWQEA